MAVSPTPHPPVGRLPPALGGHPGRGPVSPVLCGLAPGWCPSPGPWGGIPPSPVGPHSREGDIPRWGQGRGPGAPPGGTPIPSPPYTPWYLPGRGISVAPGEEGGGYQGPWGGAGYPGDWCMDGWLRAPPPPGPYGPAPPSPPPRGRSPSVHTHTPGGGPVCMGVSPGDPWQCPPSPAP